MKIYKKILLTLSITFSLFFLYSSSNALEQLNGSNRYETCCKISRKCYKKANTVILVNGENISDSLCASTISHLKNAPIFLVKKNMVPNSIKDEINRLESKEVLIIGGKNSIDSNVEKSLSKYSVMRVGGVNRYETSEKILSYIDKNLKLRKIILVNGESSIDALLSGPYVSKINGGILLVKNNLEQSFSEKTKNIISRTEKIIIGGPKSLSTDLEIKFNSSRIYGKDRIETSKELSKVYNGEGVILINKDNYIDAVTAISLSNKYNYSMLLYDINSKDYLFKKYNNAFIFTSDKIDNLTSNTNVNQIGNYQNLKHYKSGDRIRYTHDKEKYLVKEKEDKEKAKKEAKEKSEKEAKEKVEKEAKEKAEKEAREKAEKEAKEKAEKEAKEKAEKEAEENKIDEFGLPIKYDLRNIDGKSYVTNVKNQFYDGGCRSFAALAALESNLMLKKENVDLSENNMENNHGFTYYGAHGALKEREGRDFYSDISYLTTFGVIKEDEDPYIPLKHDFNPASYLTEEQKNSLVKLNESFIDESKIRKLDNLKNNVKPYKKIYGLKILNDIDCTKVRENDKKCLKELKENIKKYGAVVSDLYMQHDGNKTFPYSNSETYNFETKSYYSKEKSQPNHAICIVGWDDNYSKENFVSTNKPNNNGAWIVKDAQSEYFGDKGYFYVSYESTGIGKHMYCCTDIGEANRYKHEFRIDRLPFTGFLNNRKYTFDVDTILFNKFTSNVENETLDSVGFYTSSDNANYKIYLLTNFNKDKRKIDYNSGSEEDVKEFIDENYLIFSGKAEKAGYHIIELPKEKKVLLKKNQVFALGITTINTDKNNENDFVIEANDSKNPNNRGKNVIVNSGETYINTEDGILDLYMLSSSTDCFVHATIRGYTK